MISIYRHIIAAYVVYSTLLYIFGVRGIYLHILFYIYLHIFCIFLYIYCCIV